MKWRPWPPPTTAFARSVPTTVTMRPMTIWGIQSFMGIEDARDERRNLDARRSLTEETAVSLTEETNAMLVVHGYEEVPPGARGGVLAIGNFDGVHRGHQALLAAAAERGRALGAPAGALVFEPHPREFFHPEEPHFRLTPLAQKLEVFETLGLDLAIVLKFNAELAGLSADDFISRVLVDALAARHVVIGHDFFFGQERS